MSFIEGWKRASLALLAIGAIAALDGCAPRTAPFALHANGSSIALRVERVASGRQPAAGASNAGGGAERYLPARSVRVDQAGMAFFIRYPSALAGSDLRLSLGGGAEGTTAPPAISAQLPGGDAPLVEYELPLPKGALLKSFELSQATTPASVESVGIAPLATGVTLSPGLVRLSEGFSYSEQARGSSAAGRVQRFDFAKVTKAIGASGPESQVEVALGYSFPPAGADGPSPAATAPTAAASAGGPAQPADPGPVEITVSAGSRSRVFRLTQNPGGHEAYFYTASLGFSPEEVSISSQDPAFEVTSLEAKPFDPRTLAPDSPIPADLETALTYDPRFWRRSDYELFSWNLVPDVLIFVFRTYTVQGHYLARFAYFIEKAGFTGRLLTTSELANLRGWNAHDYRPEDIARLYETARQEGVQLRPQEIELRSVLEKNGIIRNVGGKWVAGTGAIISVAESSWLGLRTLLLTHEAFHGIFFTHPQYRAEVRSIWEGISPAERLFWLRFLGSDEYNVGDPYLVVNEFQAYLLQQPLSAVDARYAGWAVGNLEKLYPRDAPSFQAMLSAHPRIFRDTAALLDAAVYQAAGVHAGELATLVPVSRP